MLPWETLRARDDRRARRRTDLTALEQLEGRQLLSYSSLGYSLPDLQVTGLAGPVASWGSTYQVTVTLQNTGASTMVEPLSLAPAAPGPDRPRWLPRASVRVPSSADAGGQPGGHLPDTTASLARRRHPDRDGHGTGARPERRRAIHRLADASPASGRLPRHRDPLHPPGGEREPVGPGIELRQQHQPGDPGPVHLAGLAEAPGHRARRAADLQPGDTIAPTFQVTNLGTARTDVQGPVQVALVASVDPDFNLGSSIVALYTLPSGIPGQSECTDCAIACRHHGVSSGRTATPTM